MEGGGAFSSFSCKNDHFILYKSVTLVLITISLMKMLFLNKEIKDFRVKIEEKKIIFIQN